MWPGIVVRVSEICPGPSFTKTLVPQRRSKASSSREPDTLSKLPIFNVVFETEQLKSLPGFWDDLTRIRETMVPYRLDN